MALRARFGLEHTPLLTMEPHACTASKAAPPPRASHPGMLDATPAAVHTGGTWSPDTHAGGLPTSTAVSPPFGTSYVDVSAAAASPSSTVWSSREAWEQASRAALLAAVQGAVLADLLDAARAAFAVWYLVVTEDRVLGSKTTNYKTTYAL